MFPQKLPFFLCLLLCFLACDNTEPLIPEIREPNPTLDTVYEKVDVKAVTTAQFFQDYLPDSPEEDHIMSVYYNERYCLAFRIIILYNRSGLLGSLDSPFYVRVKSYKDGFFSGIDESWVKIDALDNFYASFTNIYDYNTCVIGFCWDYGEYKFKIEFYHPKTDRYFTTSTLLLTLDENNLSDNNIKNL